jgi:hypothetical protein
MYTWVAERALSDGVRVPHKDLVTVSKIGNVQVTPTTNGGGGDGVRGLQARKCKSRSIYISKTASNTACCVLSCLASMNMTIPLQGIVMFIHSRQDKTQQDSQYNT